MTGWAPLEKRPADAVYTGTRYGADHSKKADELKDDLPAALAFALGLARSMPCTCWLPEYMEWSPEPCPACELVDVLEAVQL